jgi:hypothetical protein
VARAQLPGHRRPDAVELGQVDVGVGLVACQVAKPPRVVGGSIRRRGRVRALAAQEAVGEPLREVREQDRRLGARRHLARGALEQRGDLLLAGSRRWPLGRRQLARVVGLVGQRGPRRVGRQRAELVGPRRRLRDRRVDQLRVDEPLDLRPPLRPAPDRPEVRQQPELDLVARSVGRRVSLHSCHLPAPRRMDAQGRAGRGA